MVLLGLPKSGTFFTLMKAHSLFNLAADDNHQVLLLSPRRGVCRHLQHSRRWSPVRNKLGWWRRLELVPPKKDYILSLPFKEKKINSDIWTCSKWASAVGLCVCLRENFNESRRQSLRECDNKIEWTKKIMSLDYCSTCFFVWPSS